MTSHPELRTAVCILRIEDQGFGLLISLLLSPDIAVLSAESRVDYARAEDALAAVRDFIAGFARTTPPAGP